MINPETSKKLFEYIHYLDSNFENLLIKKDPCSTDKAIENIAALFEETGELCAEVRKMTQMTFSKKKTKTFSREALEDEVVDVLTSLLTTAKACGIHDLNEAIHRKIKKNNDRGY